MVCTVYSVFQLFSHLGSFSSPTWFGRGYHVWRHGWRGHSWHHCLDKPNEERSVRACPSNWHQPRLLSAFLRYMFDALSRQGGVESETLGFKMYKKKTIYKKWHWLVLNVVHEWIRLQPRSQGLSSSRTSVAPGGGKLRDPGNEVARLPPTCLSLL